MIPKAKLILLNPISYSDHVAQAKNPNSTARRITPGVTIGAVPERLGSLGTANVPHIAAKIIGIPIARTYRSHPSLCFQPHMPTDASADISSRNRIAKLIGCDPIRFYFDIFRLNPCYITITHND